MKWWKAGVVYHVYPRSFLDSNGDGVGDLEGLLQRLDYLNDGTPASLGISAIWLSPIYPSPGRDGGYDVADHAAIDPAFGDLETFDRLVAEAHKRRIRVILDLVLNHTSDLHPWFVASRGSRDSPRRDWYVWRDPGKYGRRPNNWRSFFGGPAWTFDEETGQYYLHTFSREQPDLNWHNPAVRQEAIALVQYWLDRGVDGFRLDVFNAYFKHPAFPNNPRKVGRGWASQRQIYNKDRPEVHEFLTDLRQLLDHYPEAMAVGETFEGHPELAASYCDKLHMAFNFDIVKQPFEAGRLSASISRWDRLLAEEHLWPCYVLSNHDSPRHAWRHARELPAAESDARAKVTATLLLTLRGTPFLYYGEEIGMRDGDIPPLRRWDNVWGQSRDAARTPMQWSDALFAGFSTRSPWLDVADDYRERNVVSQEADERSVLNHYRRLIWLRNSSQALQVGSWTPVARDARDVLTYVRQAGDDAMFVALNLTPRRVRVDLAVPLPTRDWIPRVSTRRPDVGWSVVIGRQLELGPYEATVFEARR